MLTIRHSIRSPASAPSTATGPIRENAPFGYFLRIGSRSLKVIPYFASLPQLVHVPSYHTVSPDLTAAATAVSGSIWPTRTVSSDGTSLASAPSGEASPAPRPGLAVL